MNNLAASATGPLVSRLPGAFYYDTSFDHTRCDDTSSFAVLLPSYGLHRHDAHPSPAPFADHYKGMQMSAPLVCILFSILSLLQDRRSKRDSGCHRCP